MKKPILLYLLIVTLSMACEPNHNFSIEILDDEVLALIDPDAKIEVIGEGFQWTEGPLWIADGNYLLFSDIPNNTVFKINADGNTSTYLKPSGYLGEVFQGREPGSNGLLLDPDGRLVLMQHGERRVARMSANLSSPKPEYEEVVGSYEGKRLNSPNDGVFDAAGNLYFTDPPYGLPKQIEDMDKQLDFQGVYCLTTSGELLLVEDSLTRPNGIALSPDGSKLYVAVSDPKHAVWYQYDLVSPGKVTNRRVFYDATSFIGKKGQKGLPDGMKMHSKGYLFATGPGGVWLFDSNGKPLARILTGQATANCAFDTDEKVLFITADDYVLKMELRQ